MWWISFGTQLDFRSCSGCLVSSQFRYNNDSLSSIGKALSLRKFVFFLAIRLIYFAALFIVASQTWDQILFDTYKWDSILFFSHQLAQSQIISQLCGCMAGCGNNTSQMKRTLLYIMKQKQKMLRRKMWTTSTTNWLALDQKKNMHTRLEQAKISIFLI